MREGARHEARGAGGGAWPSGVSCSEPSPHATGSTLLNLLLIYCKPCLFITWRSGTCEILRCGATTETGFGGWNSPSPRQDHVHPSKNLGLRSVYDWLGSSRVDWRVGGLFDNIGTHKHEIDEDRLSSLFLSSASVWKTLLAIKGPKYLHRAANFTPLYASGQMQPPSHSPRLVFGWT